MSAKKPRDKYQRLIKDAIQRVAEMDKADGGTQVDVFGYWQAVRTAMLAIEAGISTGDMKIVAEAQVMLSQIEMKLRPADSRSAGPHLLRQEDD